MPATLTIFGPQLSRLRHTSRFAKVVRSGTESPSCCTHDPAPQDVVTPTTDQSPNAERNYAANEKGAAMRGALSREGMARRVAQDIPEGAYVNLGIGLPTKVSNFLPSDREIILHTENGMLGMGPVAVGDEIDYDLVNAGKIPVTELPGASYFHQADSFGMMRGGHLDICVLGALRSDA